MTPLTTLTTLAYKYVALALMLTNINHFTATVGLTNQPITMQDVRPGGHALHLPDISKLAADKGLTNAVSQQPDVFSGSVVTDDYFFGFPKGRLANFMDRKSPLVGTSSDETLRQRQMELSKQPSLITTNEACVLAREWLSGMGVDMAAADKQYTVSVKQMTCLGLEHKPDEIFSRPTPLPLPFYTIEWQKDIVMGGRTLPKMPVIRMTLSGLTKKMTELHILEDSLLLRPRIELDTEALLKISDDDFKKMNALQLSNLVVSSVKQKQK